MVSTQVFFTSKGARVQLTQQLGRGGEGTVFATGGDPNVVAKIYHEALSPARQEKLRMMVNIETCMNSTFPATADRPFPMQTGAF